MEKVTGIKFIDNFINKKGIIYSIRLVGWIYLVTGGLSLLGTLLPFWKADFLSQWSKYNVKEWVVYYAMYKDIILGPLCIVIGVGFLKIKQWGRRLLLMYYGYSILEQIYNLILGLKIIVPQMPNVQYGINNYLFKFAVTVGLTCFAIYIFTRLKVKEMFR